MQKILLPVANSLLGTNLIHTLLGQGYSVKGLVRDSAKYKGLLHANLELIEAGLFDDLTNYLPWLRLCYSCGS